MLETSNYTFAFVTAPGAESATGWVIGPSRRVRVSVEALPGVRCNDIDDVHVISETFPLIDDEKVAVVESLHPVMLVCGYTPDMIDSVGWDFRVRQPAPPPAPSRLDDELFEDYSDGWKHVD